MDWVTSTKFRDEVRAVCKKVAATKKPIGIVRSGQELAMIVAADNYAGNLASLPEVTADFAKGNVSFLCLSAVQGRDQVIASSKFKVVVTRAPNFKDEVVDACVARWKASEAVKPADDFRAEFVDLKALITDLAADLRGAGNIPSSSIKQMERRISELEAELIALKARKKPGPKPKDASGVPDAADGGR